MRQFDIAAYRFQAFRSEEALLCCTAKAEASVPTGCADAKSMDRKERQMASIKIIAQKLSAWRRYRETVRELSQMSDHELGDIGLHRCDIECVARQTASA